YDPGLPPGRQPAALDRVFVKIAAISGSDSRPATRPSGDEDVTGVIYGLEIRSCRRGDMFLRVTSNAGLGVRNYDLKRYRIAPARFSALRVTLAAPTTLDDGQAVRPGQDLWLGKPGCDFEKHDFPDESGLVQITVGLEGRPKRLQAIVDALSEIL